MAVVSNKSEKTFLYSLLIISSCILSVIMQRRPKQDWLFAYLYDAITNVAIDKFLTKKFITYPTRLLPRIFDIHILYDTVLYPTATVIYNQMTRYDKLPAIIYKVLYFSVPLTIFEFWAERKTGLIKWSNGWKWYHTFLSVNLKSLITRGAVEIFRRQTR